MYICTCIFYIQVWQFGGLEELIDALLKDDADLDVLLLVNSNK